MAVRTVKKPTVEEDWLALRDPYIGGSQVAAILGLSPWTTPVELYLQKTHRFVEEPKNTEALRLGKYLEAYAAMRYEEETCRTVRNYNFMLVDDENHICGDVDRLVVPEGAKVAAVQDEIRAGELLECKTSGVAWEDGVPPYYEAQVQQYMGLTGCVRADFAVVFLAPRREFRMFSVERDDAVIEAMRERCKEFFEKYVLADTPPPAKTENDCKILWARSRGLEVEADELLRETVERIRTIEAKIRGLEGDASELKASVMAALGEADTLVDADGKKLATWKSAKDSTKVDYKAAFEEVSALVPDPDAVARILAAHTETKAGARRFLLAKKEAK